MCSVVNGVPRALPPLTLSLSLLLLLRLLRLRTVVARTPGVRTVVPMSVVMRVGVGMGVSMPGRAVRAVVVHGADGAVRAVVRLAVAVRAVVVHGADGPVRAVVVRVPVALAVAVAVRAVVRVLVLLLLLLLRVAVVAVVHVVLGRHGGLRRRRRLGRGQAGHHVARVGVAAGVRRVVIRRADGVVGGAGQRAGADARGRAARHGRRAVAVAAVAGASSGGGGRALLRAAGHEAHGRRPRDGDSGEGAAL